MDNSQKIPTVTYEQSPNVTLGGISDSVFSLAQDVEKFVDEEFPDLLVEIATGMTNINKQLTELNQNIVMLAKIIRVK